MWCRGEFPIQHRKTIGTEFREKNVMLPDAPSEINMMVWEIGGEHVFAPMSERYLKDAHGVVIMFSTTDRPSFEKVKDLHARVQQMAGSSPLIVLVQNKADLIEEAVMSQPEVEQLARELRVKLYRTTSKDVEHADRVFSYLASKLGNSAVALADIGDVIPSIGEAESPMTGCSDRAERDASPGGNLAAGNLAVDKALGQLDAKQQPVKGESQAARASGAPTATGESSQARGQAPPDPRSGTAIFPSAVPTGPSKQRTNGKVKRGCACM